MAQQLSDLIKDEAGDVWRHFFEIAKIPRPSRQEEKIREYIFSIVRANEWTYRQDSAGNIAVSLPGRGRLAQSPVLVIQAHLDMVCEKNRHVNHDFTRDPISLRLDGDWVCANGTTLGADNGIGVAMMLALANETPTDRMPLELLFTADEETGLTGAMQLDPSIVHGRMLLNLDSEDEGVFTIGCSGGVDIQVRFPLHPLTQPTSNLVNVQIFGLRGGHSGVNIHEHRGNAIRFAAVMLQSLASFARELKLVAIHGGNKKNAIPRECSFSVIGTEKENVALVVERLLPELQRTEPEARMEVREEQTLARYAISGHLIDFITQIPNGVLTMDPQYPHLVQTSSSVGVVRADGDEIEVVIHPRSSCKSQLLELEYRLRSIAEEHGGTFTATTGYPGWTPNPNTKILRHATQLFQEVFGKAPEISAIHAGLETGILGEKLGIDELLSIGPTIQNAHSPDERVSISSVASTYRLLQALVSSGEPPCGS